jgi:hypothetical protein
MGTFSSTAASMISSSSVAVADVGSGSLNDVMAWDLLMLRGGLSEKERGYIAYAVRRYFLRHKQDHPLLKYADYRKVPVSDLLLLNLKFVIHETA